MAAVAPPAPSVLHPRATPFTVSADGAERRIGFVFGVTGLGLVLLMGIAGIVMRLTQATVISLAPAWFYRLLTLHGVGMITGVLLVTMGAAWYVVHPVAPLRPGWMLTAHGLIGLGAACVLVATLGGGFGAGWTFLPPLPFYPAAQWGVWSESLFFIGLLFAGAGFFVFCLDVLEQLTSRYGGLSGALGLRYLVGREETPPPPQVVAATVVAIDGLIAAAVGSTILTGLLGRTYDPTVGFDVLVAKNFTYFFGHSIANLTIYLGAAVVYVIMPRYAGRPYVASKPFVAGWTGSLIFIVTGYSHHLYMDFVQPEWAQIVSEITSYTALLPVAVITIYSMTMLVWGSAYRWTLASALFYVGLTGWAIGGVGAVIDSIIPFNFRFHNTDWVVAHFHTYLILGVLLWAFAFLAHLLERDSGKTASSRTTAVTIGLILVGGYGLTGTWFVAGTLGIPRRYAIQPPGTAGYSLAGGIFALILACGFLLLTVELVRLGRAALARRSGGVAEHAAPPEQPPDSLQRSGAVASAAGRSVPLATPMQLAVGVALAIVALAAFFPQVIDASESSIRYHHLDHAGHFTFGLLVGLVAGSLPWVSSRIGDRASLGVAGVIAAPTAMMLVMVPRFYEPLERHPPEHALYHLGMAAFGFITGLAATRLGAVTGRVAAFLTVGMAVMFAAAMT